MQMNPLNAAARVRGCQPRRRRAASKTHGHEVPRTQFKKKIGGQSEAGFEHRPSGVQHASHTSEPSAAEASNARQKYKYLNHKIYCTIEHANVCDFQTRGNQMRRAGPGLGVLKRTKNS
jgi:hypothetical protein